MTTSAVMSRRELIVAVLAAGKSFMIGRLLKAVFLVSQNIPRVIEPQFQFELDYCGPFDPCVGVLVEELNKENLAEIYPFEIFDCYLYRATDSGREQGSAILSRLSNEEQRYIKEVSTWVMSEGLTTLLRSIYEAHPEIRDDRMLPWLSARKWDEVGRKNLPAPPQD